MAELGMAEAPDILHLKFEEAFNAGDLEGLVELYEEDAVLAAAPGLVARGRAEIRQALVQYMAGAARIAMETVAAIDTGAGVALLHGKWKLSSTGPEGSPIEMTGSNAEVVRWQANGGWLFLIDNPFGG